MKKTKILISLFVVLLLTVNVCSFPLVGVADEAEVESDANIYEDKEFEAGKLLVVLNEATDDLCGVLPEIEIESYYDIYREVVDIVGGDKANDVAISMIGKSYVITLSEQTKQSVIEAVEKLQYNDKVSSAEPNYIVDLPCVIPNDPFFDQPIIENGTIQDQWGLTKIKAPQTWDIINSTEVKVAVIDTGVDYTHPDLAENIDMELAYNSFDRVEGNVMDADGHGTSVAGVIAAIGNNQIGISGVAWNIKIVPIKIHSSANNTSEAAISTAIAYATANNIKIATMSRIVAFTELFEDTVRGYTMSGGLYINSTGNSNSDVSNNPNYTGLASVPGTILVGASTITDERANFSNYGAETVTIFAPGQNVAVTLRDSRYGYASGTSVAAPMVAGAAALIMGANPNFTNLQVRDALIENADYVESLDGLCLANGRLNIYAALNSLGNRVNINHQIENGTITPSCIIAPEYTTVFLTVEPEQGFWLKPNSLRYVSLYPYSITAMELQKNYYYFSMPPDDAIVLADFYMLGDVNLDGAVDISDVLQANRHVAELTTLTGDSYLAADVDGDNEVTIADVNAILSYVSGNSNSFPIEE